MPVRRDHHVTLVFPAMIIASAAALFFAAQRFGLRGVALAAGAPLALMILLWLALQFYWIDHTGDDDAEVAFYLVVIWFAFSSIVSALGLAFRKRR